MKHKIKLRPAIFFLLIFTLLFPVFAQKSKEKPNAEINKMLKEISAKNIETSIRKLVSFGTRNTLSEQDNPTRGIGAARDWIFGEIQKISNDCGGCLQVEKQTFLTAESQSRSRTDKFNKRRCNLKRHNRSRQNLRRFRSLRFDVFVANRCEMRRARSE